MVGLLGRPKQFDLLNAGSRDADPAAVQLSAPAVGMPSLSVATSLRRRPESRYLDRVKFYWVYMMANARNTVLYLGVTNNIERRVKEHKEHLDPRSFTARYNVEKLVWYEAHQRITAAIVREKQLKEWKRAWKERLIREMNPEWQDLAAEGRIG